MILLTLFAFIGGVVTILSPCILPILPIILSGSIGGKRKPVGVVTGFVISFTFFTLSLATIVKLIGIPAETLRGFSVAIIFAFGLTLLIPKLSVFMEQAFSKLTNLVPKQTQSSGFFGGFLIGLSLGLIWTPCVGPIIASVITLAASSNVNLATVFITLSYSLGTALPMLLITYTGRTLFEKNPWLLANTSKIQKGFGVLMLITAVGIYFNIDRKFQTFILETFPNYSINLTQFENNSIVKEELKNINK